MTRRGPRFKPITPPRAHPAVVRMVEEMNRRRVAFFDLSVISGVAAETMRHWLKGKSPSVHLLEAALNALDLELVIRPRAEPRQSPDRNPEPRIVS